MISMVAAGLLLNVSKLADYARAGPEILHIRNSLAVTNAAAGDEVKANQYAMGRGYGQYSAKRRTKMSYFKRNRNKQ